MTDESLRSLASQVGDRLDFGEYELAAYITILEAGSLPATDLADRADIPQTRVYDIARDLERRGLVEVREGRPMTVAALDPKEAFEEVRSGVTSLFDSFAERYAQPDHEDEGVSLVRSRRSVLRHIETVVEAAEYELALSLTPTVLERIEDSLRSLRNDGVHVSLLLAPQSATPSPEEYPYAEVADTVRIRRGVTTPVVAVADGVRSVYATQAAIDGQSDRYGVIFNRSELGFLVSGFYSTLLWSTGEEFATDAAEQSFPREYASLRRCVEELQRLAGPFYATIRGRDVETGEPRQEAGPVVDTRLDPDQGVASLIIEAADGSHLTVGGRVAAYEDIEAHHIDVERR